MSSFTLLGRFQKDKKNTFEKTRLVHNSKKYDTNTFTENFITTVNNLWQKNRK